MFGAAISLVDRLTPKERLEVLSGELVELTGQRNAIDGLIVADIERDELAGFTWARSIPALVAWKTGISPGQHAHPVRGRAPLDDFPECTALLRAGRISLDAMGVLATRAAPGSDAHYAPLAPYATVTQLRTAVRLEPAPPPTPDRADA